MCLCCLRFPLTTLDHHFVKYDVQKFYHLCNNEQKNNSRWPQMIEIVPKMREDNYPQKYGEFFVHPSQSYAHNLIVRISDFYALFSYMKFSHRDY